MRKTHPDLPTFTYVELDYFGPIETKRGRSFLKRYGVLFTCMSCSAILLEMACSLDTDPHVHALRRFICRQGQVKHIWYDNSTNLVDTERKKKKALTNLNTSKIQ